MSDSYPPTLKIGGGLFRQERSAAAADPTAAGVGYTYDAGEGPGLSVYTRVSLVRCPSCGEPLQSVAKGQLTCTGNACRLTWYATLAAEPGRSPTLALTTVRV